VTPNGAKPAITRLRFRRWINSDELTEKAHRCRRPDLQPFSDLTPTYTLAPQFVYFCWRDVDARSTNRNLLAEVGHRDTAPVSPK